MNVCVYDNPTTFRRECWQDGKLMWFISAEILILNHDMAQKSMRTISQSEYPWKAAEFLDGDERAMVLPKKEEEYDTASKNGTHPNQE